MYRIPLQQFKIKLKDNKLFINDKQLIPKEDIPSIIEAEILLGMPRSIEQTFFWLQEKYIGISRPAVKKYLQSLDSYQTLINNCGLKFD